MSPEKVCCPSCHHYGNNQNGRDQASYRCKRCGTTWPRVGVLDDTQYCPMCEEAGKQLEAANKQRELELLAVIKRQRDYIKDRGHEKNCEWHKDKIKDGATYCDCGLNDVLVIEPSQALREHEAKVLEQAIYELDDLFTAYPSEHDESIKMCQNVLRRMAEERRKK